MSGTTTGSGQKAQQIDLTSLIAALNSLTQTMGLNGQNLAAAVSGLLTLSNANPVMDGTGAPGTSTLASRSDHVHPSDTSRAALAAVQNTVPIGVGNAGSGTTISATTGTFTAPSSGALVVLVDWSCWSTASGITSESVTATLSGLVQVCSASSGLGWQYMGYLPMVASQTTTVTANAGTNGTVFQELAIRCFFLPLA